MQSVDQYSGFHLDPELASRDDFWLTTAAISLKKGGGIPFSFPQTPTDRPQNLKISIFSVRNGHFGPIKNSRERVFMDTGFRHLLALNGRNFGINAHLAVIPTPYRQLQDPKPKGGVI